MLSDHQTHFALHVVVKPPGGPHMLTSQLYGSKKGWMADPIGLNWP